MTLSLLFFAELCESVIILLKLITKLKQIVFSVVLKTYFIKISLFSHLFGMVSLPCCNNNVTAL